jgi:hypothetical protein
MGQLQAQMLSYVVKADVRDRRATTMSFSRMKTMYGGKHIAVDDTIFVFASETSGGTGLIARGVVTKANAVPRKRGVARQTPRVSIEVKCTALARRRLGRAELKAWRAERDGSPQAELDFKLYRQATNKIVGISDAAARFLNTCFGQ